MSGLSRKKITVRTKKGKTYQRSVMVKATQPGARKLSKKQPYQMKVSDHAKAYRNHFAMNLGQGVRDAGFFAKDTVHHIKTFASDTAYHVKNIAADAYYGLTPPQWNGHTPAQVRNMRRGSFTEWYRKGRH